MLVLTNAGAGSSDHRHLDRALAVLRRSADVEVVQTGEDGPWTPRWNAAGGARWSWPAVTAACT